MDMRSPSGRVFVVLFLSSALICGLSAIAETQGIQQSPYSAADVVRRGAPEASDSLYVSSDMLQGILPLIPNLQFGYLYDFGNNRVSSGRFTADYLLPFSLSPDSMIFGEAHTEFQDFWKTHSFNNRVDMSFGGGYRTLLSRNTLLGVNGFYDTSRLGGTWYSSGGVGLQMAALLPGNDAIDLNFNWYGQLFNSNVIQNAFRYGPSNFDFQAGYSHELWNGGPDFRLSATGYKFDIGNSVWGWNGQAELWSRDAMFVLRYYVGQDAVNDTYQEVGGYVNIGFQLENIFRGESPFSKPEPIFNSPRNSLRYLLVRPVNRNMHQPATVIIATSATSNSSNRRFLVATANPGTVAPGFSGVKVALSPTLTPSQLSGFTTLTITWTVPVPPKSGIPQSSIGLAYNGSGLGSPVLAGTTSLTLTRSGVFAQLFGDGWPRPSFNQAWIVNNSAVPWAPGVITFTYQ
jgi:hypothetical protein